LLFVIESEPWTNIRLEIFSDICIFQYLYSPNRTSPVQNRIETEYCTDRSVVNNYRIQSVFLFGKNILQNIQKNRKNSRLLDNYTNIQKNREKNKTVKKKNNPVSIKELLHRILEKFEKSEYSNKIRNENSNIKTISTAEK